MPEASNEEKFLVGLKAYILRKRDSMVDVKKPIVGKGTYFADYYKAVDPN